LRLLLDTNAQLWWLSDDGRLGASIRAPIDDPGNDVLVSVVSLREIAAIIEQEGLMLMGLPRHYRDPFDYLPMAHATVENPALASGNRPVTGYPIRMAGCARG
jgi:PIN domain nuclease of toxin-antitoxin system